MNAATKVDWNAPLPPELTPEKLTIDGRCFFGSRFGGRPLILVRRSTSTLVVIFHALDTTTLRYIARRVIRSG